MKQRINFFLNNYSCSLKRIYFGIVDDEEEQEKPASLDLNLSNEKNWNCKVNNPQEKIINFYPLDKVISLFENDGNEAKCCDAMLEVNKEQLVFIELKNRRKLKVALNDAVEQLKSSIKFFKDNHNVNEWSRLEAYVANRKHPSFAYFHKDICQKFKADTGFRLFIMWQVNIK